MVLCVGMATKRPSSKKPSRAAAARPRVPASAHAVPVTQAMLVGVRTELVERMTALETRLEARLTEVEARLTSQIHLLAGEVARIGVLVEEQNARNAIVLEAIRAMIDRQDRFDQRLTALERTA